MKVVRKFSREVLEDPLYRENVKMRALVGELPPQIEALLYYYAYGKPVEQIELTPSDLPSMSYAELQAQIDSLTQIVQASLGESQSDPGPMLTH